MAPSAEFAVNPALTSMIFIGRIVAWCSKHDYPKVRTDADSSVLSYAGKRPIYFSTLVAVAVLQLIIGVLAGTAHMPVAQGVIAALMVIIHLMYSVSAGHLCKPSLCQL